jgi:hypothetical protein
VALLLGWAHCGALDAVGTALRACSPIPSVRAPLAAGSLTSASDLLHALLL